MAHGAAGISRRAAVLALGGIAGLAQAATRAGGTRQAFDPSDPAANLRALRRMMFADHEDLVFWWMKGTKYGFVDNVSTALFGMEVATILRCRNDGPGRFVVTSLELVYYTDPERGTLLEHWQNPYTGESVDMKYAPVGPARVAWSGAGPEMPKSMGGATIESTHVMEPASVVGDDVWLRSDTNALVTRPAAANPGHGFRVHDWAIYHARLRDLEDPSIASVATDVSFVDLTDWPPSLKMGERPGTCMSRCVGRKVASLAAMPKSFLGLLGQVHPAIARDPAAALESGVNRFER
jgi:hypothetical protein